MQASSAPRPSGTKGLLTIALGMLSLFCCGGIITGVPAALIGQRAVDEVGASQASSKPSVKEIKIGLYLAILGSAIQGVLFGFLFGQGNSPAGMIAFFLTGLAGVVLGLLLLMKKIGWLTNLWIGLALLGALWGFAFGSLVGSSNSQEMHQKAEQLLQRASNARDRHDRSETARIASLKEAEAAYGEAKQAFVEAGDTKKSEEVDGLIANARNERAKAEQDVKEANATNSFGPVQSDVRKLLAEANASVRRKDWSSADETLDKVNSSLQVFQGTTVEGRPDFQSLVAEFQMLKKVVTPKIEATRAAERLEDELRGPKPLISAWDGSCRPVEKWLKDNMNDPDSYEHIETSNPVAVGPYWVVVSRFRGRNGFGGMVVNTKKFWIQNNQVVKIE